MVVVVVVVVIARYDGMTSCHTGTITANAGYLDPSRQGTTTTTPQTLVLVTPTSLYILHCAPSHNAYRRRLL